VVHNSEDAVVYTHHHQLQILSVKPCHGGRVNLETEVRCPRLYISVILWHKSKLPIASFSAGISTPHSGILRLDHCNITDKHHIPVEHWMPLHRLSTSYFVWLLVFLNVLICRTLHTGIVWAKNGPNAFCTCNSCIWWHRKAIYISKCSVLYLE